MEERISDRSSVKISIRELQSNLEKRGFNTVVLNSDKEVKDFINEQIPDETTVGLGDSITSCKLKVRNLLSAKGANIFYSWDGSENYNRSLDTFDTPVRPHYYITRITALTADGRLLMKDYEKHAAEEFRFPENVYAFVGLNRLVEEFNLEQGELKYPAIEANKENKNFTVALLPFLDY